MKSGTPAERRSNPSFFRIADLPGAPARLFSAGHRTITQPATAKWRPMEASAQWAVRRRRKRPEAVSAQRSVGPAPRGPQAYWANGTQAKAGTTGRGCAAGETAPNRREPCRAGGRWGGLNRSRRRTRPRRPGRPFLRGMPRTRAAGPGADGAAWVGEKVLQMSASDSRKSPAVMQSFCVKKLSLSSCQAIRSGVRSIRLET